MSEDIGWSTGHDRENIKLSHFIIWEVTKQSLCPSQNYRVSKTNDPLFPTYIMVNFRTQGYKTMLPPELHVHKVKMSGETFMSAYWKMRY